MKIVYVYVRIYVHMSVSSKNIPVSFMWPYSPHISSVVCTYICRASYLLSGLDDTASLAWWCSCLNESKPVGVSEQNSRAFLFWGDAAAKQRWREQEGGRKGGTESTDSPFSSSAVSDRREMLDGVVSDAEVLQHHCLFHLLPSSALLSVLLEQLSKMHGCPIGLYKDICTRV